MWGSESETQAQGNGKGIILTTGAAFGGRGTREGATRQTGEGVQLIPASTKG